MSANNGRTTPLAKEGGFDLRKRCALSLFLGLVLATVLAGCGGGTNTAQPADDSQANAASSAQPAAEADQTAPSAPATADPGYEEYVGNVFVGQDPWGGTLAVTVSGITDGKMNWTFVDASDSSTLYQEVEGTEIADGHAEFTLSGEDLENGDTFDYAGTLDLKDGEAILTLRSGAVVTHNTEGDSSSRMADALADSGLSNSIALSRPATKSYTVQEGDSAHGIAEANGITTKELLLFNTATIVQTAKEHGHVHENVLDYASELFPGEVLIIPSA